MPAKKTGRVLPALLTVWERVLSLLLAFLNDRCGCSGVAEDPPAVLGLCLTQGDVIIFWTGNIQFNIQVP